MQYKSFFNSKHNRYTTQYLRLKEKMLCQVIFKYDQMMILIQQFLPKHFYSNSTDKNLT